MKTTNLEQLRRKLEVQRQDVMEVLSRLGRETRSLDADSAQDDADRCVVSISKESLFEQSSQRRTVLRLIETALRRIKDGSFGICAACGDEIQPRRLEAVPWTQFCLRCQEQREVEAVAGFATHNFAPATALWRRTG